GRQLASPDPCLRARPRQTLLPAAQDLVLVRLQEARQLHAPRPPGLVLSGAHARSVSQGRCRSAPAQVVRPPRQARETGGVHAPCVVRAPSWDRGFLGAAAPRARTLVLVLVLVLVLAMRSRAGTGATRTETGTGTGTGTKDY